MQRRTLCARLWRTAVTRLDAPSGLCGASSRFLFPCEADLGPGAPPQPFSLSPTPTSVSYGEEEIQQERALYADEELSERGTGDTSGGAPKGRAHDLGDGAVAAPVDLLQPLNLFGKLYPESIAQTLREQATAKNFQFPIWSTLGGYIRFGLAVLPEGGSGIQLQIQSKRTVELFNIQQSNYKFSTTTNTFQDILKDLRRQSKLLLPRDIGGRYLNFKFEVYIRNHWSFTDLQKVCPLWIKNYHLELLSDSVKKSEKLNFIAVPMVQMHAPIINFPSIPYSPNTMQYSSMNVNANMHNHSIFYNISQLENSSRYTRNRDISKQLIMLNSCGKRYSSVMTFRMFEYCYQYFFNYEDPSVWITESRLKMLGGQVINKPRFSSVEAQKLYSSQKSLSTVQRPLLCDSDKREEGVVPPPFVECVCDEIVTLYNSEQTDVHNLVYKMALNMYSESFSYLRNKSPRKQYNDQYVF
ncbi:unnamed protein product [Phytomonas sp. Hart1]|nr:unnamed protein product [Phytomonas sp. Hart1]|eukprot:CCW71695.1 unnamed protein product [Phytomonas sp. isolate Hart1]